jgi:hypothetical protein
LSGRAASFGEDHMLEVVSFVVIVGAMAALLIYAMAKL